MKNYYLLTAVGPDKAGIVADVTNVLRKLKCNLEDSSMMRLGSQFGMMMIFTASKKYSRSELVLALETTEKKHALLLDVRSIVRKAALFKPAKSPVFIVSIHGKDRAGLVHEVTRFLAKNHFNISDLSTHRTSHQKKPGYILIVEGEFLKPVRVQNIQRKLEKLKKKLKVSISIRPVALQSI